jgi:hypothetical protein
MPLHCVKAFFYASKSNCKLPWGNPDSYRERGIERKFKFDFDACLPTKAGPPELNGQASVGAPACGRQV